MIQEMKQHEQNPNEECKTRFSAASKDRSNKNAKKMQHPVLRNAKMLSTG